MKTNENKELNMEELNMAEMEQVSGGVMVEAYEVLATGVAKVTQLIYRLFH